MPIVQADIDFHLSGGVANADPDASLGGVISVTEITDATLHNLFDIVGSDETTSGDTEYRCMYVKNNHGTLTLQNAVAYIDTNTPHTDTSMEIGLGTSAIDGTEQTVANESTAPTGVTFSSAGGVGNALSIGDIAAGGHKAIWVKRIVSAAAAAYNSDSGSVTVNGDTGA